MANDARPKLRRLVLDVLKPHHPDSVDFCLSLAALQDDLRVGLEVVEMDERTETTRVTIEGGSIDVDLVRRTIEEIGASLHSVDVVEARGASARVD